MDQSQANIVIKSIIDFITDKICDDGVTRDSMEKVGDEDPKLSIQDGNCQVNISYLH